MVSAMSMCACLAQWGCPLCFLCKVLLSLGLYTLFEALSLMPSSKVFAFDRG